MKTKNQILVEWCHAPWHSWLKEEPQWLNLFAELWARMPEEAMQATANSGDLVILPPVQIARVIRLDFHHQKEGRRPSLRILQLEATLLNRPKIEALGILAHELAHLCVPGTEDELVNDLAADALARRWGFDAELDAALATDLEANHPRRNTSLAA